MATVLKLSTPGVYTQEISTLPPSVAEVETAIPAFIGYTEKDTDKATHDLHLKPAKISSLAEYETLFGKSPEFTVTVTGSNDQYNVALALKDANDSKYNLYDSMRLYFDNGGGQCYVVSAGTYADAIGKDALKKGLDRAADIDEVTILAIPEAAAGGSTDYASVVQAMIGQASSLKDRFALIDPLEVTQDYTATTIEADCSKVRDAAIANREQLQYAAAYYPFLSTSYQRYSISDDTIISFAGSDYDGKKISVIKNGEGSVKPNHILYNAIVTESKKHLLTLPPSPAIAALYVRVDTNKGVWKAPANETLTNVLYPSVPVSNIQQGNMNIDPNTGKSINAIRTFPGYGTLVWGARTLNGNDNEWRYISVRRFFNMVEESIKKSSQWAVFEPNTIDTWVKMEAMIRNYLFLKWREGALAGAKEEQAFYVKVGLGSTMTSLDILEGRMNVEIGMAVARPAEFIVLKFSQLVQQS